MMGTEAVLTRCSTGRGIFAASKVVSILLHGMLVVLLALTPGTVAATDTLDCDGDLYSVQLHVGAEGIVDFTLFNPAGEALSGTRDDLVVAMLEWPSSEGALSGNFVELHARDGFPLMFTLYANDREGRLTLGAVVVPLSCDWRR